MWELLQTILFSLLGLALIVLIGQRMYAVHFRRTAPPRKRRHARQHESRFPYRLVAYLFLGLALVLTGWLAAQAIARTLQTTEEVEAAVVVIGLAFGLSVAAFRRHIRQNMPSAREVLENDLRPPVLYLRSFDQENLKFVDLRDEEKAPYNDVLNFAEDVRLPGFEQNLYGLIDGIGGGGLEGASDPADVTFERYFRAEFMQRIGPLVALGNPEDDLPAEGAYRDYQVDDRWKDVFFERVRQCTCIVMQPGSSNNLQFELTSILARGICHKLFIITAPQEDPPDKYAWLQNYLPGQKLASWELFSAILRDNGYQLPKEQPGIGSVLTFEPDGSPLLLVQDARRPDEYVVPIARRLADLRQRDRPSARFG
jgi:hypothetical protein